MLNEKLTENNYMVVPNFISGERASALAEDFNEYATTYDIKNDPQVDKCLGKYDYIQVKKRYNFKAISLFILSSICIQSACFFWLYYLREIYTFEGYE